MKTEQERAHILIVEDDLDIRESMTEILEDRGYAVSTAADGLEALQQLSEGARKPDLILLDLMMPNMNGLEFREEQLKNAEDAAIPVAIISADGNVKEKSEKARANGFLRKPLKVQPLIDLVEQLLRKGAT
jgi:two-component system, chemotaxis family, chemotaxis protein CheY